MGDSNLMQPLLHPVNNEDDGSGDGDDDVNNDDDDDERVDLRNWKLNVLKLIRQYKV